MTQGSCPSCGAPVRFTAGSARIVVCEHCRTVVARTDVGLESRGKVAAIVDTESPLRVGVEGKHGDRAFRVLGRLQKDFGAGPWDEWYLELDGGGRAWLSESEGEWHLMVQASDEAQLSYDALAPDRPVEVGGKRFIVEELGESSTVAAQGELPSDLDPEAKDRYADCTGPGGAFVTLDFGTRREGAEVFSGRRVALDELRLSIDLAPRARREALRQARCTQCNGPLELRAPDRTQRVACPYCGALLDVSQGKLRFLQALGKPEREPWVPLGAKGSLDGIDWVCIAFLARHCVVDGTTYPWTEALLFNPSNGFAWLVESSGHWEFLRPIAAGDLAAHPRALEYGGRTYRRYQGAEAITDYVLGECYWAVAQGETSRAEEFIHPPETINREVTPREVTYTAGRYLDRTALEKAFGLKALPPSTGVGAAQPNPFRARAGSAFAWAAVYGLAVVALSLLAAALSQEETVLEESVALPAGLAPGSPEAMHFSAPFEIHHAGGLAVTLSASPLENDWLGLDVDLVNDETGEVTSVYEELSYYHGWDSDGAWSEGETSVTSHLSRVEPGRYLLRVTPWFEAPASRAAHTYGVALQTGSPRFLWTALALLLLGAWPVLLHFRSAGFEQSRWAESS